MSIEAALFAVEHHKDQTYGNQPYFHHLSQVVRVLEWAGVTSSNTLEAGWLHDVIEDTDAGYEDVAGLFGKRVADIVQACTSCEGNRRTRTAFVLERLRESSPFEAKLVKMADRIANMENSKDMKPNLYKMYLSEIDDFLNACDVFPEGGSKENNTAFLLLRKRLSTA